MMKLSPLTGKERRIVLFAIGLGAYAMAVNTYFYPKPSELGILKHLTHWLLNSFGPLGLALFWVAIGTTLLFAAMFSKD